MKRASDAFDLTPVIDLDTCKPPPKTEMSTPDMSYPYRTTDPYGVTRSIEPRGVLPQQAWQLDPSLPLAEDEIEILVECLNIDSASFIQIAESANQNPDKIIETIKTTIKTRGKQHNPVTSSGGMLLGSVGRIGPKYPNAVLNLKPGDKIASLVSLSLTPLELDQVLGLNLSAHQLKVRGRAFLFASSPLAKIPSDLSESMVLSALDVCGAPGQAARMVKPNQDVAVLGGGGKSGVLILYQAKLKGARTLAVEYSARAAEKLKAYSFIDQVIVADATQAVTCSNLVKSVYPKGADLVFNCANVSETEMATILSTKEGGQAYFFSMATSFSRAALGAEGLGADVTLIMGNGFVPGHSELTLQSLRDSKELYDYFAAHSGV